jgi:hypothetical protein
MTAAWKDVRCASIRVEDLPSLADLRRETQIRVAIEGNRAWIYWERSSEEMLRIVVGRILPRPGAQLFTERDGRLYRLGEHLPAFSAPIADCPAHVALHQVVLPEPITGSRPDLGPRERALVRVVRDESGRCHEATALRCPLGALATWANLATPAQLARLRCAWTGRSGGSFDDPQVFLLGSGQKLPLLPGSQRFWGDLLLIRLGFRADPDLPEPTLRLALGSAASDLVVLDHDGFELIPRDVFRPLDRAAIRLAADATQPHRVHPTGRNTL